MGVDYDGVGGIGIEFTDEMAEKFSDKGLFTVEEWDDDPNDCMERIGILYCEAGWANYGGERRIYLVIFCSFTSADKSNLLMLFLALNS